MLNIGLLEEELNERKHLVLEDGNLMHTKEMSLREHCNLAYYEGMLNTLFLAGFEITNTVTRKYSTIKKKEKRKK